MIVVGEAWRWRCAICGVRSFATFASAAEAEMMCKSHESQCKTDGAVE